MHEQKQKEYYVLILFGTNFVSYNIASALYQTNYRPVCLFPRNYPTIFRWSAKFHKIKESHFELEDPGYVGELIAFIKGLRSSAPVLTFLTNDVALWFWTKNALALSPYGTVLPHNVNAFFHKQVFFERMKELPVVCPKTWYLRESSLEQIPFLVKPTFKDFQNRFQKIFASNIKIIRSKQDFLKLETFQDNEVICQEILDYRQGDEYSWCGYRNTEGKIFSVAARHRRKYPDKFGRITHLQLVDNPYIVEKGNLVAERLQYTGIGNIQFIYDRRDKEYKLIEFNPRFWCSHEILLMAGINLIRQCADDFYNCPEEQRLPKDLWGVEKSYGKQWFSILDNIFSFHPFKLRCTECCFLEKDNLTTKVIVFCFLMAKLVYFFLKFKLTKKGKTI